MESVVRAVIVYFMLLLVFRVSGKRSLDQTTPFEFIMILMLGGVGVPAMQGDDRSLTNAVVLVSTLMGTHIGLALLTQRYPALAKLVSGTPILIVERGKPDAKRMSRMLLDDQEILASVRGNGMRRLSQI